MRIVWINELATGRGGAERYVTETARHLRDRGDRSFLLYDVRSRVDPDAVAPFDGAFPIVDLEAQLDALSPDVVYVHQAPPAVIDALARTRRPVVRFLHDHRLLCLREHKYMALGKTTCTQAPGVGCYACLGFVRRDATGSLELLSLGTLRRRIAQTASHEAIVVGSRYMRDQAVAAGMPADRVHVVPLYAETPATTPTARDRTQLLFVGALTTGKGLDLLLRALVQVPRAHLGIVGDGPQRADLERLAIELGLSRRVSFAGRLAGDDLAGMYARAACLVMPARQPESFGLVGVEAMSHAVPVVATRAGGVTEWLVHGKNGLLVAPGSVDGLAAALARILEDHEDARRMGEAGREMHRSRFRPEHHIARLSTLLAGLVRRSAA